MSIIEKLFLAIGMATDAATVNISNGMQQKLQARQVLAISFSFGFFQFVMPLMGYALANSFFAQYVNKAIPYIALILLGFLGGKMLYEAFKKDDEEENNPKITIKKVIMQSIATSIDAFSIGILLVPYSFNEALLTVFLIGIVTVILPFIGFYVGRKFGDLFKSKAEIVGGLILIIIGIEIFLKGILH